MRARIKLASVGGMGSEEIELDGQRVEHGVYALALRAGVSAVPELVLSVRLGHGADIDLGEVHAIVPDETAEVLRALGWTPPEDSGAGTD